MIIDDSYLFDIKMSDFEFDFFAQQPPTHTQPHNNLEDVMNQIEQRSVDIDFDQFGQVLNNPQDDSLHSDLFRTNPPPPPSPPQPSQQPSSSGGKKRSDQPRQYSDLDASRNIHQISYMNSQGSFRYEEAPPSKQEGEQSGRYARLQQMLSKAKGNSLDAFYKGLDNAQAYRVEEKFRDKEEFKYYSRELKTYKRDKQQQFQDQRGSYRFIRDNMYQPPVPPQPTREQQPSYNFTKKQAMGDPFAESASPTNQFMESRGDPFGSNGARGMFGSNGDPFATQDHNPFASDIRRSKGSHHQVPEKDKGGELAFQPDDGFDFQGIGENEAQKEVEAYKQKEYEKQAQDFFNEQQSKQGKKQKQLKKLSTIREQHPQMTLLTAQQQKMGRLLTNYQQMKNNFSSLMGYLRDNNTDQQRIISELKNLKTQYRSKQDNKQRQQKDRDMKRMAKEADRQAKQNKMSEIKEQIKKMKESEEKDMLYLQINDKIEKLEEVVKTAISDINLDREQKFVPKIINYYSGSKEDERVGKSRKRSQVGLSRSEHSNSYQQNESSVEEGPQEEVLGNLRKAVRELQGEGQGSQQLFHLDEFTSPLQLDLTTQEFPMSLSRNRSQQLQLPFVPPPNSHQYTPNSLDTTNRHLRRCLTQKSSVLFQSFQFYVTGRFTICGQSNGAFPVVCEVRVANKCAVNLSDVFMVVYGPQAQESELNIRPNRLVFDQLKSNNSQFFEVDLSKSCLDSGYFNIQISYKADSMRKKKVNFKAVLPFVQLIKPQFVYQEQLLTAWNHMENEWYVRPKPLDFRAIRSHQDLKLILPFIEINQSDPNAFSYGVMFTYPKSTSSFMLKVVCYVSGKASLHLKSTHSEADRKLREEILDVMSFLCFAS